MATIQSILNKIATMASRTGLFSIQKGEFFDTLTDITNKVKEVNDNVNSVAKSLIWQSPVANFADLATTYPNAVQGWAAMVTSLGFVYSYNGSAWKSTGLNSFPADVATKASLAKTLTIFNVAVDYRISNFVRKISVKGNYRDRYFTLIGINYGFNEVGKFKIYAYLYDISQGKLIAALDHTQDADAEGEKYYTFNKINYGDLEFQILLDWDNRFAFDISAHQNDWDNYGIRKVEDLNIYSIYKNKFEKIGLLGDSIVELNQYVVGTKTVGWWNVANAILDAPFELSHMSNTVATFAKSGKTAYELYELGYANAAANSDADAVIVCCGTNGFAVGSTSSEIASDIFKIWDLILSKGKVVISIPVFPRSNYNIEVAQINKLLHERSLKNSNIILLSDVSNIINNPNSDGANFGLNPIFTGDGTHPNEIGDAVIGKELARSLMPFFNGAKRLAGLSIIHNPHFVGDNNGLADWWENSGGGLGTVTTTKVSLGHGYFAQKFEFETTNQYSFQTSVNTIIPGGKVKVRAKVKVSGNISTNGQISISMRAFTSSSNITTSADVNRYITDVQTIVLDELTIPAETTSVSIYIVVVGTGTVELSSVSALYSL
jgi:lysophospholipase L1-like esterase